MTTSSDGLTLVTAEDDPSMPPACSVSCSSFVSKSLRNFSLSAVKFVPCVRRVLVVEYHLMITVSVLYIQSNLDYPDSLGPR